VTSFLQHAAAWLQHASAGGLPRGTWVMLALLMAAEWALGRSRDPRLRSLAASVAAAVGKLLALARVDAIPVAGPLVLALFRFASGAPAPAPAPNPTNPGGG
jgi:hypothetical protein